MDYIKSTDFAVKDVLPTGDPSKKVKGTEIDTEFNNIAEAIGTKLNKVVSAVTNNLPTFNNIGEIQDSGISSQELILEEDIGVSRADQISRNEDLYREASVTLSSLDYTLSEEQSTARLIRFTGTLGANVTVTFPDKARTWEILNDTTGDFTVTIKTPGQSTGLVLKRGTTSLVRASGGNLAFAHIPADSIDPDERVVTDNVNEAISGSEPEAVGTYALLIDGRSISLGQSRTVPPGTVLPGSDLRYANVTTMSPDGDWKCMGYCTVTSFNAGQDIGWTTTRTATLWLRIS